MANVIKEKNKIEEKILKEKKPKAKKNETMEIEKSKQNQKEESKKPQKSEETYEKKLEKDEKKIKDKKDKIEETKKESKRESKIESKLESKIEGKKEGKIEGKKEDKKESGKDQESLISKSQNLETQAKKHKHSKSLQNPEVKEKIEEKITKTEVRPCFKRVDETVLEKLPEELQDNSYYAKFKYGKGDNFAQHGAEKLLGSKGKNFKKEKTKLKNKAYQGGSNEINPNLINSIKLK